MSSTYMNDTLTPAKGFIDFDENGDIILVPTMPKPQIIPINNKKRKADNISDSYECNVCHKKFVKKSYCKRHELSHEEKFACKICGSEFMHNIHLTQHMLVHKEKQYKCDICGMQVRYKFNLTKHRKIHIPYKDETGNIKYFTVK
jgi:hypothetical protein